jgi:SpoVK/Ycf46/Vps4 family AAA+-type ATPase
MRAIIYGALRTAHRFHLRPANRTVADARRCLQTRNFHRSTIAYRLPDSDVGTSNDGKGDTTTKNEQDEQSVSDGVSADVPEDDSKLEKVSNRHRRRMNQGSGLRKTDGSERLPKTPLLELPEWFLERNMKVFRHSDDPNKLLTLYRNDPGLTHGHPSRGSPPQLLNGLLGRTTATHGIPEPLRDGEKRVIYDEISSEGYSSVYSLHADIYNEVLASIRVGLTLRPPSHLDLKNICRPDVHLLCPRPDASNFLNSIVQRAAFDLEADIVILDPEDIAQIVSARVGEDIAWTWGAARLLGYTTAQVADTPESISANESPEDKTGDGEEFDWFEAASPFEPFHDSKSHNTALFSPGYKASGTLDSSLKLTAAFISPNSFAQLMSKVPEAQPSVSGLSADSITQCKLEPVLEALIDSVVGKRFSSESDSSNHSSGSMLPRRRLIVQINQYKEMSKTNLGNYVLQKLKDIVKKRWHRGKDIMIVGTSAGDQGPLTLSKIRRTQSYVNPDDRTILVTPMRNTIQSSVFKEDDKLRIRQINIRHLENMIRQLAAEVGKSLKIDLQRDTPDLPAFALEIYNKVWSYARVHRLAVTMLGMNLSASLDGRSFVQALQAIEESDNVKYLTWGTVEKPKQEDGTDETADPNTVDPSQLNDKMRQIMKTCTTREQELLCGVVNPADIHTTFDDIRAPTETIDALKTLTSLALIRPESFSYGVLANDKITGLLLYGPPGTGKTLLAKAVAKESGATVLEVSSSELRDMYVGESEKNVKAVFSLARKLSPCVIFLDEADSLLRSRGGDQRRPGHRGLINQFLREWDGLKDMTTLLMVATNRPFDLDEAVLRRLPRKILMDLPVEKDREAILKIHLRDEILDESVSLNDLAKQTPFYSGSDLKNLSIAAALACVRDENLAAAQHVGDTPYIYPEKRTLTKKHFDSALEEISASISEDMSTLSAIRKFDARYGDRKGRRKRGAGLGFGGTSAPENDSEAVRVRKIEVAA